jgi:hypothetical protein
MEFTSAVLGRGLISGMKREWGGAVRVVARAAQVVQACRVN